MNKLALAIFSIRLSDLLRMSTKSVLQRAFSTEAMKDSYDNITQQIIELTQRKIYRVTRYSLHTLIGKIEVFFKGSSKRSWSHENCR